MNNGKYGFLGLSMVGLSAILIIMLQIIFLAFAVFCGFQAYDAFFVSDVIGVGIAWSIYPVLYVIGLINR